MLESLESRRFLSSGVTVTQNGDELIVRGGGNGSNINVEENNHSVLVEDGGIPVGPAFTGINKITITGQAQNDIISYTGNTVGAKLNGGGGNDLLIITDNGSAGSYASGDGDDDTLQVLNANNTTVIGDGGGDILRVSAGIDITKEIHIYGMGGSDKIEIAGGKNFVYGGGGKDWLQTFGVENVNFVLAEVESIELQTP